MPRNRPILAFIHIEKAAGQTFIRLLENSYGFRHCRVAPLRKEHNGIFTADAMRTILKINPFVEAISGHSIRPHSDLETVLPRVRYIALMRDPVERYLSHYQYWVNILKKRIAFEEFMELDSMRDFQTKKIAGEPDLDKATEILSQKVFLVGTVEKFNEFLIILRHKLAPYKLKLIYRPRNVASTNDIKRDIKTAFEQYEDHILENNQLDLKLYDFVKNDLFQRNKLEAVKWGKEIEQDHQHFGHLGIDGGFVGKVYRNLYFGPIINIIRYRNGLKVGGSY